MLSTKMLSRLIALCLCACLSLSAAATHAEELPLPHFTVVDIDKQSVTSDQLKQTEPWVLLVVSANQTSSFDLLSKLERKKGDWAEKLTIVATGSQQDFDRLVQQNNKLSKVRWYRDEDGSIMQNLALSGWPVMIGIIPGDYIAWTSVGVPSDMAQTQSLVSSWVGLQ